MEQKKKSNKLIIWLILAAVVLIVVAVVGKRQGWIGQPDAIEVEFAKATRQTIVEKVSASGEIQPEVEVKLSPDVAGEIIELYVEEGDSVVVGQLLIKIRPDNFESAVERTRANLNQQLANLADAKARFSRARAQFKNDSIEFNRNVKLIEQQVISDTDYQTAEVRFNISKHDLESAEQSVEAAGYIVQSARATVSEANENLRLTSVIAPMSGIVSKLDVEKGERVVGTQQMAGTEMLRIADLGKMEVRVNVNENDIVRVNLGDTTEIDVDAYDYLDAEFRGVVSQIANTANQKISSDAVTEFEVRIRVLNQSFETLEEFKNKKYPFKPGMTASVDIITDTKNDVLSVPIGAVTIRNPADTTEFEMKKELSKSEDLEEVVFVHNNSDEAEMVTVKTGISDFDYIEIKSGIDQDTEVISGPFQAVNKQLRHKDRVKEIEEEERTFRP
ncbi:MAG: efflux RND transporter periplasmic adaptor subunit [Cyclobacteriaceae bacterium]